MAAVLASVDSHGRGLVPALFPFVSRCLLQERGMSADHVTVWRWVQRYAPELDRRLRSHLKPTNKSWRVDETYIRVKGKWTYLYRAVDSAGVPLRTSELAS
jgi:transposase-like protein